MLHTYTQYNITTSLLILINAFTINVDYIKYSHNMAHFPRVKTRRTKNPSLPPTFPDENKIRGISHSTAMLSATATSLGVDLKWFERKVRKSIKLAKGGEMSLASVRYPTKSIK